MKLSSVEQPKIADCSNIFDATGPSAGQSPMLSRYWMSLLVLTTGMKQPGHHPSTYHKVAISNFSMQMDSRGRDWG